MSGIERFHKSRNDAPTDVGLSGLLPPADLSAGVVLSRHNYANGGKEGDAELAGDKERRRGGVASQIIITSSPTAAIPTIRKVHAAASQSSQCVCSRMKVTPVKQ
jgi:hypothetical protein